MIWGIQEFPRWFQGPWLTLPLWPDFDLKISHFWPPRAHEGRMAGAKTALNHVFLLVLMWFEVIKSFHDESPSQTDPAIVTWFWPKNHPFLRPPCSQLKHGNGQNCFKPTWYMSKDYACATDSQSKHIYGRDKPCYETLLSNCCHWSVLPRQFSTQGATCHRVGRVQDFCSSIKPFFSSISRDWFACVICDDHLFPLSLSFRYNWSYFSDEI